MIQEETGGDNFMSGLFLGNAGLVEADIITISTLLGTVRDEVHSSGGLSNGIREDLRRGGGDL